MAKDIDDVIVESGIIRDETTENSNTADRVGTNLVDLGENIKENELIAYENTIYVDPLGDATVDGKNPARPTTFANAIANLAFSTNIILAESATSYTTGGAITLNQSNVTITALQGGTGSNSTFIADNIDIVAGTTRFRAYGIRFDGAVEDDGSDGRHYFSWCSLGGTGSFLRSNPQRWCNISECDFSSGSFAIIGTGTNTASTTLSGASSITGLKVLSASDHTMRMIENSVSGGATLTNGSLILEECDVIGGANAINASVGTSVTLYNCHVLTSGGTPQTITLAGSYNYQNSVFDLANSTLTGNATTNHTSYWTGPIQTKNYFHEYEYGDTGNWPVGNYLRSTNGSGSNLHLVKSSIEIFALTMFNNTNLAAGTELEIVQAPFGTPVVLATVETLAYGQVVNFTPVGVGLYQTIGVRLKAAPQLPENTSVTIRYRILD